MADRQLVVDLIARTGKFQSAINAQTRTLGRLQSTVKTLGVTMLAAAGVAGVGMFTRAILQSTDRVAKLARDIDVTVQQADALSLAFSRAGMSAGALVGFMGRLNVALHRAGDAGSLAARALDGLGLDRHAIAGKNTYDVLREIGGALENMGSRQAADALSNIFGQRNLGRVSEALRSLENADARIARIYGALGLGDAAAHDIEGLNDSFTELTTTLQLIGRVVLTELTPALLKMTEALGGGAIKTTGYFERFFKVLSRQGETAAQKSEGWIKTTLRGLFALPGAVLNFTPVMREAVDAMIEAGRAADEMTGPFAGLTEALEAATQRQAAYVEELEKGLGRVLADIQTPLEKYSEATHQLSEMHKHGLLDATQYARAMRSVKDALDDSTPAIVEARKFTQEFADQSEVLRQKLAELRGLSAVGLIDEGTLKRGTAALQEQLDALDPLLQKQIALFEEMGKAAESVFDSTRTDFEKSAQELDKLFSLLRHGMIDLDTFHRARAGLFEDVTEETGRGGAAQQAAGLSEIVGRMGQSQHNIERDALKEHRETNRKLTELTRIMASMTPTYG